jgi:hypothetical protein
MPISSMAKKMGFAALNPSYEIRNHAVLVPDSPASSAWAAARRAIGTR